MSHSVFPTPYDGETVYHYTDAAGLIGMVQDRRLRATESSGLNDPREVLYGQELLQGFEAPEPHRMKFEENRNWAKSMEYDVFVACATTRQDDVSQWTRYTPWPDAGYCVGLSTATPLGVARSSPSRVPPEPSEWARMSPWSPAIYGQSGFEDAISGYLPWAEKLSRARVAAAYTKISDEMAHKEVAPETASALRALTCLVKPEGFEAESEVRLVTTARTAKGVTKFRSSRYGVVRYVDLVTNPNAPKDPDDPGTRGFVFHEDDERPREPLPIVSVVVGPSPFAERGLRAVRQLLSDNGYEINPTVSANHIR